MKRRDFISLLGSAVAAWPLAARAQRPERVRRIGVLVGLAENDPEMKARIAGLRQGLEKFGWAEGILHRLSLCARRRSGPFARERTGRAAARRDRHAVDTSYRSHATRDQHDPDRLRRSCRPDRFGFRCEFVAARRQSHRPVAIRGEHHRQMAGDAQRNCTKSHARCLCRQSKNGGIDYFLRPAKALAPSLAIELVPTPVDNAADIERAIEIFAREPNGGLVLPPDTTTVVHRDLIIALASRHRLPAVYASRVFVAAGGLMCYGPDSVDLYRQAASYVDSILRGAKAADLPVRRRRSSKPSSTSKRRRHLA